MTQTPSAPHTGWSPEAEILAHTERGDIIAHDGVVTVRIVGVDEVGEIDADTAVRYLSPENAQQLIHDIAESLDTEEETNY